MKQTNPIKDNYLYMMYFRDKKKHLKGVLYEKSNYGLFTTLPLYSMFLEQEGEGIDGLLKNKVGTYKATFSNLGLLFEERDKIKDHNVRDILYSECKVGSYLGRHDALRDYDGTHRQNLENQLSKLEEERRDEEIKCWQDKAKLAKDTMEALSGYSRAVMKSYLMN